MAPKSVTPSSVASSTSKVASVLRERIQTGYYDAGQWLPAERVLAEDLGVHRRTVRAAVAELANEGLLHLRPNCRPTVIAASDRSPNIDREDAPSRFPSSRLVALVMWHGGADDGATAQQRIFWGMNQALAHAGYHGVFLDLGDSIGDEQENATREAMRLNYALEHGFGGIIFYAYAYQRNRELIQRAARRVPLVLIDRMLPGIDTDFVGIDNFQAMYDAVQHLVRQGHRRIAYVTWSEPINPVQDRLEGYRSALRDAFGSEAVEMTLTTSMGTGRTWLLFDNVFQAPPGERPTAVVCVNDHEAVRVAERLSYLGLRIPEDVAMVGFDNLLQRLPNGVGLTSVAQPFEEIGRRAGRTFLNRIAMPTALPVHIELPAQILVRESSQSPLVAPEIGAITAKSL